MLTREGRRGRDLEEHAVCVSRRSQGPGALCPGSAVGPSPRQWRLGAPRQRVPGKCDE